MSTQIIFQLEETLSWYKSDVILHKSELISTMSMITLSIEHISVLVHDYVAIKAIISNNYSMKFVMTIILH